eukprot:919038-Pelagomonas_calceolata.AAC.3
MQSKCSDTHRCKADAMTLQVGHCDAQQLPARGQMPYSNVAYTSSGKNLAVLIREGQIIDLVVVGCLDELVCQPAFRGRKGERVCACPSAQNKLRLNASSAQKPSSTFLNQAAQISSIW